MITHNPELALRYESIKWNLTRKIAGVNIGALGDGGPVDAELARVRATGNPVSTYSDHPLYKVATFGAETVLTLKYNQIPASDTGRPICSPIYQNPIT
jgi:hypothetical protein